MEIEVLGHMQKLTVHLLVWSITDKLARMLPRILTYHKMTTQMLSVMEADKTNSFCTMTLSYPSTEVRLDQDQDFKSPRPLSWCQTQIFQVSVLCFRKQKELVCYCCPPQLCPRCLESLGHHIATAKQSFSGDQYNNMSSKIIWNFL